MAWLLHCSMSRPISTKASDSGDSTDVDPEQLVVLSGTIGTESDADGGLPTLTRKKAVSLLIEYGTATLCH